MAEKTLNTRIQQKHDIELNWNKAINFIPKIGEIIVYDIDENYTYERFKIGDGTKTIVELPFTGVNNINGIEPDKNGTVILHANDVKAVTINLEETNEGEPALTNADMLGGIPADQYALKEAVVTSFNGQTGDIVFEGGGFSTEFIGATAETDGAAGAVPAPVAGDQDKYLRADGSWSDLPFKQSNWDMNDSTDASYIENRPFYDSRGYYTVLEEMTFEIGESGRYVTEDILFTVNKLGSKVIIDGIEYENYTSGNATSFYQKDLNKGTVSGNMITLGNFKVYNATYSRNYPDELWIEGPVGVHTISVTELGGELVKIDTKYLPDNLVTAPSGSYYEGKVLQVVDGEWKPSVLYYDTRKEKNLLSDYTFEILEGEAYHQSTVEFFMGNMPLYSIIYNEEVSSPSQPETTFDEDMKIFFEYSAFGIRIRSDNRIYANPGVYTISLIEYSGQLSQIEEKFISDEIARVEDMILPGEETTTETIGSMDIHVDTADTAYDSEKLGGLLAEEYALKSEIIGLPFLNRIMVSLPSSGWIQEASGRYTQNVVVGDITSHSKCHHVDIDMSGATEENINDIRHAWSLIDIVEATDAGVLFTAFNEAPAIDLNVYIDIEVIKTTIPNANGVIF